MMLEKMEQNLICGKREAPRCGLLDCVDMGTRPGLDNGRLIIGGDGISADGGNGLYCYQSRLTPTVPAANCLCRQLFGLGTFC